MLGDRRLVNRVLDELRFDPRVDASGIGVTAAADTVTLFGRVASLPERCAATDAARAVRGVRTVVDEIAVELRRDRSIDDGTIAERIARTFEWNVSIPDGSVDACVDAGFVTLHGEVDRQDQRVHAEHLARHVGGVTGIANLIALRVGPAGGDIALEIETALARDARLETAGVRVAVDGGKVVLGGNIWAAYERELVERIAWAVPGVHAVVDELHVV